MKKLTLLAAIICLTHTLAHGMYPTSPIQPTHKAPADKGLGLGTAHPEQTKCVEGRRDSNHAIAPEEQRRMEKAPVIMSMGYTPLDKNAKEVELAPGVIAKARQKCLARRAENARKQSAALLLQQKKSQKAVLPINHDIL